MDSLTHLAAGALTPLAFPRTPLRASVIGFGIAVGELPDIDVFFGLSSEAFLTLHRGVSHALFWQPVMVFLAVLPFYIWMHAKGPRLTPCNGAGAFGDPEQGSGGAPGFFVMWLMALAGVCIHIYLDSLTTFGTQIFLPFSDFRAGLPAMFIIDPLLTLPLLVFMGMALRQKPVVVPYSLSAASGASGQGPGVALASSKARRLALAGLAWALLYPLGTLGANVLATDHYAQRLAPGGRLFLLPEAFSPFVWKALADEGDSYRLGSLNLLSPPNAQLDERYEKPDPALYESLKDQQQIFAFFGKFCTHMVQLEKPASPAVQAAYARPLREISFMDARYIVTRHSPVRLLGLGEPYFVLQARVNDSDALVAYRFLRRGEGDVDVPWIELQ